MIVAHSVYARAEDVVSCELEGGSALLDLNSSMYFRLNDTAHFVWEALGDKPLSPDQIADALVEHYTVEKEDCLPDVLAILTELKSARLITEKA